MSILRQNEQHEQIETMANHGPCCRRIKNDKYHPQINHVEETENVKWCVFNVPQYTLYKTINNASVGSKCSCILACIAVYQHSQQYFSYLTMSQRR